MQPSVPASWGYTPLVVTTGRARLREVVSADGFGTIRRAAKTPFNMILEARP
jgi:hypothetical protein